MAGKAEALALAREIRNDRGAETPSVTERAALRAKLQSLGVPAGRLAAWVPAGTKRRDLTATVRAACRALARAAR